MPRLRDENGTIQIYDDADALRLEVGPAGLIRTNKSRSVGRDEVVKAARGVLAESHSLNAGTPTAAGWGTNGATSTLEGSAVGLAKGETITNIICMVAAVGTAVSLVKMGIVDKNGVLKGVSADLSGALAANSYLIGPLAVPYVVEATDLYYLVGLSIAATTNPTMYRSASATGTGKQISTGFRAAISQAGLTDIAANVTAGNGDNFFWFACS